MKDNAAIKESISRDLEPTPADAKELTRDGLLSSLAPTVERFLSQQRQDGYWWYSLEANETIGAEFIYLMHYLGEVDAEIQEGIKNRILDVQRSDGTWAIYHDGPPDLSTTIESYFALRIAGVPADDENMVKARQYIVKNGGIEECRVFTKIHLAMFGIIPWSACPEMPAWFILMPNWIPFNIYEFSSWARATIVPLLIFMTLKKNKKAPKNITLDELFRDKPEQRKFRFKHEKGLISIENMFLITDKALKILNKIPISPLRKYAISKCSEWTWEHVKRTEDIYPALAYCALAFKAIGYHNDSPQIRKPFQALKMFQQRYATAEIPALPDEIRDTPAARPSKIREIGKDPFVSKSDGNRIHQQCCISPVWDTPWMMMALLETGLPPDHPALLKAARWLIGKQIRTVKGDWKIKNPLAKPGGWSFEFENDYFPDVDDTIEVLTAIDRTAIPEEEKSEAVAVGIDWMLSMQCKDGGWGAFDINQNQQLVNRIPFSDHKACLDPSTPDITGRMLEYLVTKGYTKDDPRVARAIEFIWNRQKPFGAWFGRWGVNYIYGTWNVLMGLSAIGVDPSDERIVKALNWLESIQRADGGWSESPITYEDVKEFSGYNVSLPSQTAWALMGLIAGGRAKGKAASRGAAWLLNNRNAEGGWDEKHYTGTGFERHFYIRYHGYRHYFPLLALGRYAKELSPGKEV